MGLLHKAGDWKILSDFNDCLIFPPHIVNTLLRPDIVIFSDCTQTVIIIELTCPCEENFCVRHIYKCDKYANLVDLVEANNWVCHFFAIEVGARGYCASSVSSFLKQLGISTNPARKLIKELALVSMSMSFKIWLARDNKDWEPDIISHPDSSPQAVPSGSPGNQGIQIPPVPTPTCPKFSSDRKSPQPKPPPIFPNTSNTCSIPKPSQPKPLPISPPVGLANLGNTCYANCILQALQVFPRFWLSSANTSNSTPLLKAFYLLMSLMKNSSKRLDPRFFLARLGSVISLTQGKPFAINKPQDASEVLQIVVDELVQSSPDCFANVCSEVSSCTTCNKCLSEKQSLEQRTLLRVPVANSFVDCISSFLNQQIVNDFCSLCNSLQDATTERHFQKCPDIFIFHIDRNTNILGNNVKDDRRVIITEMIKVSEVVDSEVNSHHKYALKAVINHSGSTKSGHYTAYVRYAENWFLCNDNLVCKCKLSSINPAHVSILFYERS